MADNLAGEQYPVPSWQLDHDRRLSAAHIWSSWAILAASGPWLPDPAVTGHYRTLRGRYCRPTARHDPLPPTGTVRFGVLQLRCGLNCGLGNVRGEQGNLVEYSEIE